MTVLSLELVNGDTVLHPLQTSPKGCLLRSVPTRMHNDPTIGVADVRVFALDGRHGHVLCRYTDNVPVEGQHPVVKKSSNLLLRESAASSQNDFTKETPLPPAPAPTSSEVNPWRVSFHTLIYAAVTLLLHPSPPPPPPQGQHSPPQPTIGSRPLCLTRHMCRG